MLVLPGSSALSVAKRDILLSSIRAVNPLVTSIDAVWIHLVSATSVKAETGLSDSTSPIRPVLDRLFAYGDNIQLEGTAEALQKSRNVIYVVPRPGSVSPWSSKATDIAALCNLKTHVERLERGVAYVVTLKNSQSLTDADVISFGPLIHDRMTQIAKLSLPAEDNIFRHREPSPLVHVSLSESPTDRLSAANNDLGLALAADEIDYLVSAYGGMARDPTDAELFMFAQVNSEHCRHKIFNASWTINDEDMPSSLFQMIRNTEQHNPTGTISAYSDNAAVFEGHTAPRLTLSTNGGGHKVYETIEEEMPILVKVETHNHPTAVSPYPGAATGSGGEIRDEGAVGRGSHPKAGLAGFTVSNLLIPGDKQPWEEDFGKPGHIASAYDIMIDAPLGAAAFNNEFGRPALGGYFRTFCERVGEGEDEVRGYHKPIMIAGGLGNVRPQFAHKSKISPGAKIIVLGGPGMLIGLGGGAASSRALGGAGSAELDFASVQRDNPEMQRRAQMVIDACVDLGPANPIQSIHDVGAGGLSNALPELVHDSGLGARFEIRDVPVADKGLSPMEIWCNESQERYVLAVKPGDDGEGVFRAIAERERALFGVVGVATEVEELVVTDRLLGQDVINLKMSTLFGKPPRMSRKDATRKLKTPAFDTSLSNYIPSAQGVALSSRLADAVTRVLRLPSVASKSFLITIGDRSVTGLVTRDQMVGPYQVPVADVAVTRTSYGFNDVVYGEAMAMGERTPLALLSPAASARIAVAESLTNLAAAYVGDIGRVKLSANWMCAAGKGGEGAGLYEAVRAIGEELCPALGVGIPVGKDSMSMSMKWKDEKDGSQKDVTAPLSLIVTAFGRVEDVRKTWTPELKTVEEVGEETVLVFFDLAAGKTRLGGSALAQVFRQIGREAPDVEDAKVLKAFFEGTQKIREVHPNLVLAYHDRSDGGLLVTLLEMAFASRTGVRINLDALGDAAKDPVAALFNEELGAIVQVAKSKLQDLVSVFTHSGFPSTSLHAVGSVNSSKSDQTISVVHSGQTIFTSSRATLQETWAYTSYRMQSLRDDPSCAKEELSLISNPSPTFSRLSYHLTFTPNPLLSRPLTHRPKVAILREQGVNGHQEMAWAFYMAGFEAVDVHMSDLTSSPPRLSLASFRGLAGCGGFSYGDVLGAGKGWANSILLHEGARNEFKAFFERNDTFALGVCNGCQFFSGLKELIGNGAEDGGWPDFKVNKSGRFEARVAMVEVADSAVTRSSPFLHDMVGSRIPVAVAHGEGRAVYTGGEAKRNEVDAQGLIALKYVDGDGKVTQQYPLNPNGGDGGVSGVQTKDGRVLALMPHPERVVALESNSWWPKEMEKEWEGVGPWFRIFQNARRWCD